MHDHQFLSAREQLVRYDILDLKTVVSVLCQMDTVFYDDQLDRGNHHHTNQVESVTGVENLETVVLACTLHVLLHGLFQ